MSAPEPMAWWFEAAKYRKRDEAGQLASWDGWVPVISTTKPNMGDAMRSVTPLYSPAQLLQAEAGDQYVNDAGWKATDCLQGMGVQLNPRQWNMIKVLLVYPVIRKWIESRAKDLQP